jgi:hypothetical protein
MSTVLNAIIECDAAADRLSATPPPDDRTARCAYFRVLGTAMSAGNDLVDVVGTGARSATEQLWTYNQNEAPRAVPGQQFQWYDGEGITAQIARMMDSFGTGFELPVQPPEKIKAIANGLYFWSCTTDEPDDKWYVAGDGEAPGAVRLTRMVTDRTDQDKSARPVGNLSKMHRDAFDYLRRQGFMSKTFVRYEAAVVSSDQKRAFRTLIAHAIAWLVMLVDVMAYLDAQSVCERVFRVIPSLEPEGVPTCAFPSIVHHPAITKRLKGSGVPETFNRSLSVFFAYLEHIAPRSSVTRAANAAPGFVAYVESFKTTPLAEIINMPRPPVPDLFGAPPGESTISEALEFFRLPKEDDTKLLDLTDDMHTADGVLAYYDHIQQGTHTPTVGLLVSSRAFLFLMMHITRPATDKSLLKKRIEAVLGEPGDIAGRQQMGEYVNVLMETGDATLPAYIGQKTVSFGNLGALWGKLYTRDKARIIRTRLAHRKDWHGALWIGLYEKDVRKAWEATSAAALEAYTQTPWQRSADWMMRSIVPHTSTGGGLSDGDVPPMWEEDLVCTLVRHLWGRSRVANNLITAIGIVHKQTQAGDGRSPSGVYEYTSNEKTAIKIDKSAKAVLRTFFRAKEMSANAAVGNGTIAQLADDILAMWPMYVKDKTTVTGVEIHVIEDMIKWFGYAEIQPGPVKDQIATGIVNYFPVLALVHSDMPRTIFIPLAMRGRADDALGSLNTLVARAMRIVELRCETIDSTRGPAIAKNAPGAWLVARAAERAISTDNAPGMMTSRALSDFSLSASHPRAVAHLKNIPGVAWSGVAFEVLSDPSSSVYFQWPADYPPMIGKWDQAPDPNAPYSPTAPEPPTRLKTLPLPIYEIGALQHVFRFKKDEHSRPHLIKEYARPAVYLLWRRELHPSGFKEHTDSGAPVCDLLTTIQWANNYVEFDLKKGVQIIQYIMKTVQMDPLAKFGADGTAIRHAIRIDFALFDLPTGAITPPPLYFVKTYPDLMADPPKKKK